jgi:hypothetical protein
LIAAELGAAAFIFFDHSWKDVHILSHFTFSNGSLVEIQDYLVMALLLWEQKYVTYLVSLMKILEIFCNSRTSAVKVWDMLCIILEHKGQSATNETLMGISVLTITFWFFLK